MFKQNGMIMLSEEELEKIIDKKAKEQIKELETRNDMLCKALIQVMKENDKTTNNAKDVRVSKIDFLKIYNAALDDIWSNSI